MLEESVQNFRAGVPRRKLEAESVPPARQDSAVSVITFHMFCSISKIQMGWIYLLLYGRTAISVRTSKKTPREVVNLEWLHCVSISQSLT